METNKKKTTATPVQVTVGRTFNCGNYESFRCEVVYDLEPNATEEDVERVTAEACKNLKLYFMNNFNPNKK